MSYDLELDLVTDSTPYIQALSRDYDVGENPVVFQGTTELGETVTAFVRKSGGAFVGIDSDPEGYVQFSDQLNNCDGDYSTITAHHSGVDEWEFEPGSFDPSAESITLDGAHASFC